MSDRLKDLATFNEEYEKLSDSRRNEFARLVNKLLRDTYVVRKKGEDASDYFALLSNRPLFESFFSFMDFAFEVDRDKEIVYVKSTAGRNRVRLGKFDTALVLVLRKLFIKKAREASSNDKIIVTLKDVIEAPQDRRLPERGRRGIFPRDLSIDRPPRPARGLRGNRAAVKHPREEQRQGGRHR